MKLSIFQCRTSCHPHEGWVDTRGSQQGNEDEELRYSKTHIKLNFFKHAATHLWTKWKDGPGKTVRESDVKHHFHLSEFYMKAYSLSDQYLRYLKQTNTLVIYMDFGGEDSFSENTV